MIMMKTQPMIALGGLALLLSMSWSGLLAGAEATMQPGGSPVATTERSPLPFAYVPPVRGAPDRRISGSTRGSTVEDLTITVLTPREVAYTTKAQPTLYWFASRPIREPIEFSLTAEDAVDPLLAVALPSGAPAGIHPISLASFGARLEPGRDYAWSVAVIVDPRQRSLDVVTTGGVRRVELGSDLAAQLASAPADLRAALYAENGLWYDAFDTLSQLIAAHPQDPSWRRQRSSLLEQVDLRDEAAYDRQP